MTRDESPLQSKAQSDTEDVRTSLFEKSPYTTAQRLRAPSVYLTRQITAQLVCYQKLIEMTKGVAGSIVECGVFRGMGLMAYANLLAALEPYNYPCRVIGFDTFEGDANASDVDFSEASSVARTDYVYKADSLQHLLEVADCHDNDRPLGHLKRIFLVKGDVCDTAADFLQNNPNHATRILHLSMNLYNPTLAALESFYPQMPQGGILVVHGLGFTTGATHAIREYFGCFSRLEIRSFDFCPNFTYVIKQ
jgi:hypothetical protein